VRRTIGRPIVPLQRSCSRVRVTAEVATSIGPDRIRDALRDFSDARLQTWSRTLDPATYEVHHVGETSAEVTEGSKRPFVWSRERNVWKDPNRITWTALESNFCAPGSHDEMVLNPTENGGTDLTVTWDRTPSNRGGRLYLFPVKLGGSRLLAWATRQALRAIEEAD
jgi:hypothetical protein